MPLVTRSIRTFPRSGRATIVGIAFLAGLAVAAVVPLTLVDFHLSGTQVGDVSPVNIMTSGNCAGCHSNFDPVTEPYLSWEGSLMGQAGRDPLFFAQMTTANQDVENAGYFCLRCHVPNSFQSGAAYDPSGSSLTAYDADGVSCHLCHSMVDPIYKPGISPKEDLSILAGLEDVPQNYGNAMFVLDPYGQRRGPRENPQALHEFINSPFHKTGEFCGTCHDVGNVAISKQPDGSYWYNAIDTPTPSEDLHTMFPLERTYSEWKLSAFADGGVDMGGRFGGTGGPVVSTCQDCHMPKAAGASSIFSPSHPDTARHEFAGASSWALEMIKLYTAEDPNVNPAALDAGIAAAKNMVQRAATLNATQLAGRLTVRVTNESGHKLPTGHIEGRRVFVNVQMFNASDALVREYGHYDWETAELDESSTSVYEMHVGLSPEAAGATGYPAGVTTHMALANVIEKDSRIPPRGFSNAAYEAAGAPAVNWAYADGQHWDDTCFSTPSGAVRAVARVYYQTVTKHYIEALRDANVTDDWGEILHDLWLNTDKGAPVLITSYEIALAPFLAGDADGDGAVDFADLNLVLSEYGQTGRCLSGDVTVDELVSFQDLNVVLSNYGQSLPPR